MIPTYTTQKKSISPTIALVRHESKEKQITLDFPNGVNFNTIHINQFTREIAKESQVSFKGPITVHLMVSSIQNCYYLVWHSEKLSQLVCSCYDFRKHDHCHHTDDVNQQQDKVVEQPTVETAVVVMAAKQEQNEVAPQQRTVDEWREIVRIRREQDRAFMDEYWKQAKLLQAQVHQPQQSQAGV